MSFMKGLKAIHEQKAQAQRDWEKQRLQKWDKAREEIAEPTWCINKTYHPEYGDYVYQPRLLMPDGEYKWMSFIEPFVTLDEAEAYVKGRKDAAKEQA